jgi:CheY-like chemotaxis protein
MSSRTDVQNTAKRSYSVLITDDDDACRSSLESIIELVGYRTYLANDGYEALRIVRREYIHVAIMDFHMPGMSGLETWEKLRQETRRVVPCVFITGDICGAAQVESLADPACMLVRKPLSKDRVVEAVERMIDRFVVEV